MGVFGTEIHIVTFIFLVFQGIILIPTFIAYFIKRSDGYLLRFAILNLLFFLYNLISGLVPDENIPVNRLSQDILAYSVGITCAIFYLYYVYAEHNIKPVKFLSIRTIFIALVIDFVFLFIIPYTMTNNLVLSRSIFLVIPLLIGLGAIINVFLRLFSDFKKNKNKYYKFRILSGIIAVLSIFSLPLTIVLFGDNQPIEHFCFNVGFIFLSISYVFKMRYLSNIDKSHINQSNFDKLTTRQKEIAYLIKKHPNKTFEELAEILFLNPKTVSSHASRIYVTLQLKSKSKKGLINYLQNKV